MGNTVNGLEQKDVEQMMATTNFSENELRRLYRRFKKLDTDGSGTLTTDEFEAIPNLATNPLLSRLLSIFDTNKDEEIQFSEFVATLSTLSDKGSQDSKLKFAFQVYDMDSDGYISNGELFQVLKMMVGKNLSDVQLQQIVDKTVIEADEDRDGKISYDEFTRLNSLYSPTQSPPMMHLPPRRQFIANRVHMQSQQRYPEHSLYPPTQPPMMNFPPRRQFNPNRGHMERFQRRYSE